MENSKGITPRNVCISNLVSLHSQFLPVRVISGAQKAIYKEE